MSLSALQPLPIDVALAALEAALARSSRVLLEAPPGAGKSTHVPLALLDAPWLRGRRILMLEPRRLAARAVAERMAHLLGESVGRRIGLRTRLDTRVSGATRIEVVTEGVLTRLLQSDAALEPFGVVIFDEFHERSLQADLGLALSLESQQTLREDLKLLVMSATLDVEPLARLLEHAPVVSATAPSFEVETHYVARRPELALEKQMAQLIRAALRDHTGDVLVFLPGAAEIGRVQRELERSLEPPSHLEVRPLYGELPAAAQDAALAPAGAGRRKIVLATSIAETSLTLPGVRVVVDSGLRRYAEFDPATGMSRLVTGRVSQAAADQRRGRAGRVSAGHCYRLWSAGVQATLPAHTAPEILHADLAGLALELACWGAHDATRLGWLDPPPAAALAQARELLGRLEALDAAGRVTPLGRSMAELGAHPRLAHMLKRADELGATRLACDIAACLSERDLLRPTTPGARDADLRLRLSVLAGDAPPLNGLAVDEGVRAAVRRSSQSWQRALRAPPHERCDLDSQTGPLLALAYPDRIGQARGHDGRYRLANGRGAHFAEPQALAKAQYLVAAELDSAERDARIFLAAPVQRSDLVALFAARIRVTTSIEWDEREGAVRARREQRLDALVLDSEELRDADPARLAQAALAGLRRLGLVALPWTRELEQWRARVALLRRLEVHAPQPWPDLSDATLLATLEDWAAPWMHGLVRRAHFAHFDLAGALHGRLSHAQRTILEREAPTHFVVPSGSRIPIDYLDGETPTLAVRLQEVFGLQATPSVAQGRCALVLKLLSPAGRPVQVTRDLVSFWSRGYHEVKRDLKGRYPKHYWPEDPYTAEPTRRVRPRGSG
ncbi:MAG TPA: ATP-dependent helicase HrpB [Steroidobacteraceae bacterium]|nr:ATP-dependent helicase HrpB [Steroidobacteraceae bacterium]